MSQNKIRRRSRDVADATAGNPAPSTRQKTHQDRINDLLGAPLESEVINNKPINVISSLVHLTDDQINHTGVKKFYSFVFGTPNLSVIDRNALIDSSTKFLLSECAFKCPVEEWGIFSHEKFFSDSIRKTKRVILRRFGA